MHPFVSGHRLLHHGAKNERMPLIHAEWQPLDTQAHMAHIAPALAPREHSRESEVFALRQPARQAPAAMSKGPRPRDASACRQQPSEDHGAAAALSRWQPRRCRVPCTPRDDGRRHARVESE
eukprot:7168442-Prymnesium_polylepis.1